MTAKRIFFSRPYPLESLKLTEGLSRIIDTGRYTKEENVDGFEEAMGSYLDEDHVIATGTGSAALVIGLHTYANRWEQAR